MTRPVIIRQLSRQPYEPVWQAMQAFCQKRMADQMDEIWLLEHEPVFTQGLAGKAEHVLFPGTIPVVQTDRGGQVTYHGPGQLMVYCLLDLNRLALNTRELVRRLEKTVIHLLGDYQISAQAKVDAPGVYVDGAKICSIGLRIRRGYCYHGLALNVDMDLSPFKRINPCGYKDLKVTQITAHTHALNLNNIKEKIIPYFLQNFSYNLPLIRFDFADVS